MPVAKTTPKPTTGALVFALNATSARDLAQQFQARTVEKTYLALVRGGEKSFDKRSGEIRVPLQIEDGRVSLSRDLSGKPAATDWELLASSVSPFVLPSCFLRGA
jgi:23S rRNA-/tRNA-specific pseudouridylate synthase